MIKIKASDHWFVDTFESLVDFFSLLSFALIIATLIFGTHSMSKNEQKVEIASINTGTGEAITLPEDTVVLILKFKNPVAILSINEPGIKIRFCIIEMNSISSVIQNEIFQLKSYKNFNLAIEKKNWNNLNSVYFKIVTQFEQLGIKEYKQYFY